MKRHLYSKGSLISIIAVMLLSGMLSAQTLWTDHGSDNSLSVELLKPFKSDSISTGFTGSSGTIFITGRYALNEHIVLVGEVSVVHGDLEHEDFTNEAGTSMGNPYLGAEFHLAETPLFIETGFRIPVFSKDKNVASLVGIASDINRMEAFTPKIFPVLLAVNYEGQSAKNILFRARLGTSIWFNSGNVSGSSSVDAVFDYMVQAGYAGQKLRVLIGITGRYLATLPGTDYSERHIKQFGTTITVPFGNIQLGAHFKLPVNENAGRMMDFVAGLNFGYNF